MDQRAEFARYRTRPRRQHTALRVRRLAMLVLYARNEWRSAVRISWRQRLRAWRHGFTSQLWVLYDLGSVARSELRHYARPFRTVDYRYRLPQAMSVNDKLMFPAFLDRLGVPTAPVLGFLHRGGVHPFGGGGATPLRAWLGVAPSRRLVLRPVGGLGGEGILFVRAEKERLELNGQVADAAPALAFLDGLEQYVITEFVEQAPYAAALYPGTTNTVRLLTLWDDHETAPFVAAAAHRLGHEGSGPVDNFHVGRGGLSAPIDLATGVLGAAKTLREGRLRVCDRHPETGAPIAGVQVESWDEALSLVRRAATALPESPFLGWDLAITSRGPCVIEANAPPGYDVWQVHGPLLRDPRARRALAAVGVA